MRICFHEGQGSLGVFQRLSVVFQLVVGASQTQLSRDKLDLAHLRAVLKCVFEILTGQFKLLPIEREFARNEAAEDAGFRMVIRSGIGLQSNRHAAYSNAYDQQAYRQENS